MTHELIELAVVRASELKLHRPPIARVESVLLFGSHVHQDVVPNQVGLRQLPAGGVHRLEHQLRVVDAVGERHVDDDQLVESPAQRREVQTWVRELVAEQVEVLGDPGGEVLIGFGAEDDRLQRPPVALRQQQLEPSFAVLVLVQEVPVADLLGREAVPRFMLVLGKGLEVLGERSK